MVTNSLELLNNSKGKQIPIASYPRNPRTLCIISIESENRKMYGSQTQEKCCWDSFQYKSWCRKKKGSLLILLLYPTITEGEWNFKNPTPSPVGEALVLL